MKKAKLGASSSFKVSLHGNRVLSSCEGMRDVECNVVQQKEKGL